MKSISMIIPYWGILPNYFNLWIKSAELNSTIDFYIFTNCEKPKRHGKNIYWHVMDLEEFKKKIQSVFDFEIRLDSPYKVCDYRPAFGYILQEYIADYEFWGYCDTDIILGNVRQFVTDEILSKYNRLYKCGHFTLFKNLPEINRLFMNKHTYKDCYSYKYVFTTDWNCAFDEAGTKYGYGMSTILERDGFNNYYSNDFADIKPYKYDFIDSQNNEKVYEYFEFKGGILKGILYNGLEEEFMYIHLQKRKMLLKEEIENNYYIVPNEFCSTYNKVDKSIKKQKSRQYTIKLTIDAMKRKLKKIVNGAPYQMKNKLINKINI